MTPRPILRAVALLLVASAALHAEVPELINYQGLLNDPMGNPVSGNRTMVVRVYDAPSGGNMTYEETIGTVEVANGTFSFEFGSAGGGIAAVLDGSGEYLALSVNGTEEDTRTRLLAVPFALRAQTISSVTGGNSVSSNATGISFTGDAAANTRTNLGLGNSSTRNVGTGESDVASGVHAHAAADVTSGIFDNDRINWAAPGAIGSTTPAAGSFTTLNASGTTELVNGSNAAGPLNIYNTFTSATNYERGFLKWDSNEFNIGTERGSGGGSARSFRLIGPNNARIFLHNLGNGQVLISGGATSEASFLISRSNVTIDEDTPLQWSGNGFRVDQGISTTGTALYKDGSATLGLRNGVNAQTFRVYNTWASATDFERLNLRWASDEFILDAEAGSGGGTLRGIKIGNATSSLLGFYGAAPVDQPALAADLLDSLQELGLIASGSGDTPLDLSGGSLKAGNLSLTDNTGGETATFDAQTQLSANRTYTLPDSDGTLALTSDIPAGLSDGDKGDITVSGSGSTWSIDAGAIGTAQLGGDITAAGGALLDDADAAAQRTTLGLSAIASSASASDLSSGTVPTARLGTGTANSTTFLRGDQTWATIGGGGASTVDASTDDVFSFSGSDLVADDGGTIDSADPFIKWDDTAGKLVYANPLSRPSGAFYVGLAPTTTALGANAVNIQSGRDNAAHLAKDSNSVCVGYGARSTSGSATAVGYNASSGNGAAAIGGSSSAGNDAFAGGFGANAGNSGVAVGRNANASSSHGGVAIGYTTTATGVYSVGIGFSQSASLRGSFAVRPFQAVYWGGTTTDDTANVELNLDAAATNRFTIAANTMVIADVLIAANSTGSNKALWANRRVAIRRDGSNNTTLVGAVSGTEGDNTGSPTWTFTIDADDTNESLRLRVTGAAGETVVWRATAMYRTVP